VSTSLDTAACNVKEAFLDFFHGTTWQKIEARPRLVTCSLSYGLLASEARSMNQRGVAAALDAIDFFLLRLAGRTEANAADYDELQRLSERLAHELELDPRP
jgi:hypothetical protein